MADSFRLAASAQRATATVLLLLLSPAAHAQDSSQLEEIVVTATRTARNIDDVPTSISVITRNQILDTPAQGWTTFFGKFPG